MAVRLARADLLAPHLFCFALLAIFFFTVWCLKLQHRRRKVKNIGGWGGGPRFRIFGGGAREAKFPVGT